MNKSIYQRLCTHKGKLEELGYHDAAALIDETISDMVEDSANVRRGMSFVDVMDASTCRQCGSYYLSQYVCHTCGHDDGEPLKESPYDYATNRVKKEVQTW